MQSQFFLQEFHMLRWFWVGCVVVGALFLVGGCGENKPPTSKVKGTVKLDGEPLDAGEVNLFGEKGTAPEKLDVKNGNFEGQVTLGKKRVEVHAYKQGPKAKMDKEELEGTGQVDRVAAKYNSESTLTAEVTASGINPAEFKVESVK
jgi:hypothetical protein